MSKSERWIQRSCSFFIIIRQVRIYHVLLSCMFSLNHFIWLFISIVLISVCSTFFLKKKVSLNFVLNICCVVCILSELIKMLSMVRMVPSLDHSMVFPYLELTQLPFHLCQIQLFLVFFVRFTKNDKLKTTVLAFMYPTTIVGALFALVLPAVFSESISVSQAFTHPMAYQFFLYHTLLVILGIYIIASKEVKICPKHYLSTMMILLFGAFLSVYINSMIAVPHYVNGELISVEFGTNFFYTLKPPINILLTEKWHWLLYLSVITLLGFILIFVMYIPVFLREKKEKARIES